MILYANLSENHATITSVAQSFGQSLGSQVYVNEWW